MSSFKRTAALWVLQQAARRLAEESARRRPSGGAGPTYRPHDSAHRPQDSAHGPHDSSYRPADPTYRPTDQAYGPADSAYHPGDAGHRPTDDRPGWARTSNDRRNGMPPRVEDLVRRAWPLLDTPANRQRIARFVERMRTVANPPR